MSSVVSPSGRVHQTSFIFLGDWADDRQPAAKNTGFIYLGNWNDKRSAVAQRIVTAKLVAGKAVARG